MAPKPLSSVRAQHVKVLDKISRPFFVEQLGLLHPKKNKTNSDISFTNMLSPPPPLEPSVNRGKQFITSDLGFPKSHYCHLSAQWATRRAASVSGQTTTVHPLHSNSKQQFEQPRNDMLTYSSRSSNNFDI